MNPDTSLVSSPRPALTTTLLVGVLVGGVGTSIAPAVQTVLARSSTRPGQQTTAGTPVPEAARAGAAIGELRRLSGLTWEQLAGVLGVSRRSLHFWASGKPLAPGNEEQLQRLLAAVRKLDRGAAAANRSLLLAACSDGSFPLDLLAQGRHDRVLELLGPGQGRPTPPTPSRAAKEVRAPRPPHELVDALQDRIHRDIGPVRPARSVKVKDDRRG